MIFIVTKLSLAETSHFFRGFPFIRCFYNRNCVEPQIVGKWEHKQFSHLPDVPIYYFGQNTSK